LKNVGSADTEEVHDFLAKFFMYTFVMPEKVKISRIRREEKLKVNEQPEN
jgi:hypothetical protein